MNTLVQDVEICRDTNDVVNGVILYIGQSQRYEIYLSGAQVQLQHLTHNTLQMQKDVTAFNFTDGESSLIFHIGCGYSIYTFEYMKTDSDPDLIPILTRLQGATGYGPAGESKQGEQQPAQLRL